MKKTFKITIEAEKVDEGVMFLHTQLASGKIGNKDFTLDQNVAGGSLILNIGKFEEHQRYLVRLNSIVKSLLDFHFEKGKDIKVKTIPIEKGEKVLKVR